MLISTQFLIIRSSGIEPSVKRRAQDELFPMWSNVLWTKTKASFDLKVSFSANVETYLN